MGKKVKGNRLKLYNAVVEIFLKNKNNIKTAKELHHLLLKNYDFEPGNTVSLGSVLQRTNWLDSSKNGDNRYYY